MRALLLCGLSQLKQMERLGQDFGGRDGQSDKVFTSEKLQCRGGTRRNSIKEQRAARVVERQSVRDLVAAGGDSIQIDPREC